MKEEEEYYEENANRNTEHKLNNIKLQDMITMVSLKQSKISGKTKKMLHAPTLNIFVVKEVPYTCKKTKGSLTKYLDDWQKYCHNCKNLTYLIPFIKLS